MRKRFIKRSLELIGAIAIVYIIIDVIDSNTKHDDVSIIFNRIKSFI